MKILALDQSSRVTGWSVFADGTLVEYGKFDASAVGTDFGTRLTYIQKKVSALIEQYKTLFKIDNVELEITDEAISAVARKAISLKTGARGLRTILENLMIDTMFDIPSETDIAKVIVDEGVVEQGNKPKLVKKEIA